MGIIANVIGIKKTYLALRSLNKLFLIRALKFLKNNKLLFCKDIGVCCNNATFVLLIPLSTSGFKKQKKITNT